MDAAIVLIVNALTPRLLEYLKAASWFPFVRPGSPWLNRTVAVVVAAMTALGITASYNAEFGVLSVSGLMPDTLLRKALVVAVGFLMQEASYRLTVREERP